MTGTPQTAKSLNNNNNKDKKKIAAMPAAVMEEEKPAFLGRLVDMGVENYKWSKDLVAQNKTLGPRLSPVITYTEETTLSLLGKSPIAVDDVVTAVDSRVDKVVTFTGEKVQAVRDAPKNTFGYVHDKLSSLRVEQEEGDAEDTESEDPSVTTLLTDVKSVSAERLNLLLDASEGYLQQYLPPTEEEQEELKVEGKISELRPLPTRFYKISKVTVNKIGQTAVSKSREITERTKNTVHVDLIKYSEWLDKSVKEPVAKRLAIVDEKLAISQKVTRVDIAVVQPIKAQVNKRVEQVDGKLVQPAKEKFVLVVTTISSKYDEKVVQPRDQIIQMFREELDTQKALAAEKSGGEDLTIAAGLSAVVAAARARLTNEWEVRVAPTLSRFMGRTADADTDADADADDEELDEELEDKSYGDADEAEEAEEEESE